MDKAVVSLDFQGKAVLKGLRFESFAFLKFYLVAIGVTLLFMAVLNYFSITRLFFNDSKRSLRTQKNPLMLVFGSVLSGIGMVLSGCDLAFLLVQAGCGYRGAIFSLAGAMVGTILFSLVGDKMFGDMVRVEDTMDKKFVGKPYYISAALIGAVIAFSGLVVDAVSPYSGEFDMISNFPTNDGHFWAFYERSWGPVICGALLGLTQFITVVVVSEGCALKDTFLPLISQITRANKKMFQKEDFPLLHKKRNVTAANFWQFLFAAGIYLGGFLSTWLTENDKFLQPTGIGPARAAIGGILLILGAQITGGSLAGHLLTGLGHLSFNSVLSLMFSLTTAFGLATLL